MVGFPGDYGGRLSNPEGFVDAGEVQSGHSQADGATCEVLGQPARIDCFFVSARLREHISAVRIDDSARGFR